MNIIFVEPKNIKDKYITIYNKSDINHLINVLRIQKGKKLTLTDGAGWEYIASVEDYSNDEITLLILDKSANSSEPKLEISLFQGIPKGSKMETIVQKSVELGVNEIVPVFMERTIVQDKGNFSKKIDRWQKISDEAVKQAKRGYIPKVENPMTFDKAVKELFNKELVVFPYENEENRTIKDFLKLAKKSKGENIRTLGIIIGPEGGFSPREVEELKARGGEPVTLGSTVLRTETAGIAAIAMCMYELEL